MGLASAAEECGFEVSVVPWVNEEGLIFFFMKRARTSSLLAGVAGKVGVEGEAACVDALRAGSAEEEVVV